MSASTVPAPKRARPDILEFDLGYNCYRLSQLVRDEMVRQLKQLDDQLTPEQWHLLLCLASTRDGQTPSELAHSGLRDKTTISRMLDVMERHQLILRVPREGDARSYVVQLSPKSRKLMERARSENMSLFAQDIFAPLNSAEREFMLALLHKCRRALGDL
jgi:DNA-binding MarR family transcriptional regulator